MNIKIILLANSRKLGGRCLAGIEVEERVDVEQGSEHEMRRGRVIAPGVLEAFGRGEAAVEFAPCSEFRGQNHDAERH